MDVSPRAEPPPTAAERFAALEDRHPVDEYNFENFCTRHLLEDGRRTIERAGIRPGEPAPDFELPEVGGGALRLSELRGRPVLLRFGSFT